MIVGYLQYVRHVAVDGEKSKACIERGKVVLQVGSWIEGE